MGFPLSVPHVAPLDSPIGEWDRRCRVCSHGLRSRRRRRPSPARFAIPRGGRWPAAPPDVRSGSHPPCPPWVTAAAVTVVVRAAQPAAWTFDSGSSSGAAGANGDEWRTRLPRSIRTRSVGRMRAFSGVSCSLCTPGGPQVQTEANVAVAVKGERPAEPFAVNSCGKGYASPPCCVPCRQFGCATWGGSS